MKVKGYEIEPGADLTGADLRYADLRGANLRYADLRGANLTCADLTGADLRYADLRGADPRYADLRGANLRYADLRGADLRYADLRGANLTGADLTGAYLTGAYLTDADLRGANLTGADLRYAKFKKTKWCGCEWDRIPIIKTSSIYPYIFGEYYDSGTYFIGCKNFTLEGWKKYYNSDDYSGTVDIHQRQVYLLELELMEKSRSM